MHCFDLRVLRFSPVWSRIWLYNKCKVSELHKLSSLPEAPYKLIRSRMIKREGKTSKYTLVRNHLQIRVTRENHSRNKSYFFVFKNIQKPKFLSRDRVRSFESKLFRFPLTQDILVDTWKFTGLGEAWNNLYVDFQIKEMNPLSP